MRCDRLRFLSTLVASVLLASLPAAWAFQPIEVVQGSQPPQYDEHQNLLYYLDAAGNRRPVESLDDWQVRRRHILAHMQTVMGPLPRPEQPVPLDVQVVETTDVDRLTRKKLSYHTDSRDRRVSAYLFVPVGPDGPSGPEFPQSETNRDKGPVHRTRRTADVASGPAFPAVLCLHQTTRIGKGSPAGMGENPNLHYALHLARRGYVTLAPDYPSFGDYDYDFEADEYISGTMKAVYDNIRAIDLLQSLPEVDGQRIGVIGHSLGGHNAMFTAAFEPRIKAIVSNCGFTRFHKYYNGRLKGWTSQRYMPLIESRYGNDPDRVPFDFTEIVAGFAPRPFLASSPIHDGNFEVSGVKDVIAAARPIYELHKASEHVQANYPDCAHDFPPEVREVAYAFLDRHLK